VFPGRGFQEEVSKQGIQQAGPQAMFSGRGSQVRFPSTFPSKVPRKRFLSKVPSNRFPGTGSQEQAPKQVSQEQVHK